MKLNNMRILVVDDERIVLETLKDLLQLNGAIVTTADNGKDAFNLLLMESFDLVLSDIRMPECSGIDLLKKVRECESKLPDVILISAFSDITTKDAISLGAKGLFMKKTLVDQLLSYLEDEANKPKEGPFNILDFSID